MDGSVGVGAHMFSFLVLSALMGMNNDVTISLVILGDLHTSLPGCSVVYIPRCVEMKQVKYFERTVVHTILSE